MDVNLSTQGRHTDYTLRLHVRSNAVDSSTPTSSHDTFLKKAKGTVWFALLVYCVYSYWPCIVFENLFEDAARSCKNLGRTLHIQHQYWKNLACAAQSHPVTLHNFHVHACKITVEISANSCTILQTENIYLASLARK